MSQRRCVWITAEDWTAKHVDVQNLGLQETFMSKWFVTRGWVRSEPRRHDDETITGTKDQGMDCEFMDHDMWRARYIVQDQRVLSKMQNEV